MKMKTGDYMIHVSLAPLLHPLTLLGNRCSWWSARISKTRMS